MIQRGLATFKTHKANAFLTKHFPVIQCQMRFIYKEFIQILLAQLQFTAIQPN